MNRRSVLKTLGMTIVSTTAAAQPGPLPTQFVAFHVPGPNWRKGVPLNAQPGVREHIEHYRKLFQAGKLAMGGPFLDDAGGGMMIAASGVDRDEFVAFVAADPAVVNGLMTFQVRPWAVGMKQ